MLSWVSLPIYGLGERQLVRGPPQGKEKEEGSNKDVATTTVLDHRQQELPHVNLLLRI
jgi:hypothetical protein